MEPVSYRLRAPRGWRLLAVGAFVGLVSGLYHVVAWLLAAENLASIVEAHGPALVFAAAAAVAIGALLVIVVLLSALISPGRVVFEDKGVRFDTAMTRGFITWTNVADAAIVPGFAGRYLAVRLNDPDAYATAAANETQRRRYRHPSVSFGVPGLLLSITPWMRRGVDLLVRSFGYSPLPKNLADENARMSWNERNYGFHVVIWRTVFPDAEEAVIGLAHGHRPADTQLTTPRILKVSQSAAYRNAP